MSDVQVQSTLEQSRRRVSEQLLPLVYDDLRREAGVAPEMRIVARDPKFPYREVNDVD
jgi:hypothetical protein